MREKTFYATLVVLLWLALGLLNNAEPLIILQFSMCSLNGIIYWEFLKHTGAIK